MNILIIEDDLFLADKIKQIFEKKILTNIVKAINSFDSFLNEITIINSYDLILIDICLWNKSKNGIDIIKIIRKKNIRIPIIMISWYECTDMMELCFHVWANDYIIKPFRLKELEVRVFKWFKDYFFSIKYFESDIIQYYELSYNLKQNKFYFLDEEIFLSKQNKYLLSIFLSHNELFLSIKLLTDKIWWDICEYDSRNIRVNILRLKKYLKLLWIDNRIQNERGEWYILKKDIN